MIQIELHKYKLRYTNIILGKGQKCKIPNTNTMQKILNTKDRNRGTQILTILGRDQQIHFVSSLIRPHLDVHNDDNNYDGDDDDDNNNDDGYCP